MPVEARAQPEFILHERELKWDWGSFLRFLIIMIRFLTVLHAKNASWNAFWKRMEIYSDKLEREREEREKERERERTWKRTKWIRKSMSFGRRNQKWSSVRLTWGTPLTTSPLSIIWLAMFVMMTCSFAPISRIICTSYLSRISPDLSLSLSHTHINISLSLTHT